MATVLRTSQRVHADKEVGKKMTTRTAIRSAIRRRLGLALLPVGP